MKKYIQTLLILIILSITPTFAYKELIIQNIDKRPVRVIKVILDGEHYVVSSVSEDGGTTLKDLAKKVGGDTAVNGGFFCPKDYSYCGGITHTTSERIYLGDGASRSSSWPDTSIRMVFGFTKEGVPQFAQNNMGNMQDVGLWLKPDQKKLESLYFGIGGFPAFLLEGENVLEGYNSYIDKKMLTAGNKTFICSTQDGSTVYMGVVGGINLPSMPEYLKKNFGCRNALNLDAGASIGMIYSGFVLDQGSRTKIMDAFVVLTRDQYIKLTGITPPSKIPYDPEITYQLDEQDQKKVKTIYDVLQPFIVQNGDKQKRSFISLLRAALTSPIIEADPQKHAIIKDLLRRLYVIGTL